VPGSDADVTCSLKVHHLVIKDLLTGCLYVLKYHTLTLDSALTVSSVVLSYTLIPADGQIVASIDYIVCLFLQWVVQRETSLCTAV